MKQLLLCVSLFGASLPGFCQVITFPYEENFEWQVKQIDEFIDRFNNADYTPIRHYLKEQYAIEDVRREDLIKSLFDLDKAWDKEKVVAFLQDMTRSYESPYLDLYDKGWYAELSCKGTYRGKPQHFTLILSIEINERTGGARWIINSVSADFLPLDDSARLAFAASYPSKGARSLNPASFGTDFMALVDALADTANFKNYLSRNAAVDKPLLIFFDKLYERQLVFQQVNHITYHFLQTPGWIFQVEDFPRQTTNSGWLISKLLPATDQQKEAYRRKHLYLHDL